MCETCGCGHNDHQHIHLMLPVKGMKDKADAEALANALSELTGIHATADHAIGAVSLLLHDDGDLGEAKKLIKELGYEL